MSRQRHNPQRKHDFAFDDDSIARPMRWWGIILRLFLVSIVLLVGGFVYLDATVLPKFAGQRWSLPAQFYAAPLALFPEASISQNELLTVLDRLKYEEVTQVTKPGQYRALKNRVVIYRRPFQYFDGYKLASLMRVDFANSRVKQLVNADGQSEYFFRIEPERISSFDALSNAQRMLIALQDMPTTMRDALLVSEDRQYYEHFGLSIRGILRALINNLRGDSPLQGASTITQQLVKNFFLTRERTLSRKLKEAAISILLELHYDKQTILEAYVNEIYLGQDGNRAIHGFGLASLHYFGRPISELKLAEQVLLVALVRGPSYYNPYRHPNRAEHRRNLILEQLQLSGLITTAQWQEALNTPVEVTKNRLADDLKVPAYLDLVYRQLNRDYKKEDLRQKGLQVFTTLNPVMQYKMERSIINGLFALEKEVQARGETVDIQVAAMAVSPVDGNVLALVGDKKVNYSGFNRALDARRQIGSLAKVGVYLTALHPSGGYHLYSQLEDSPLKMKDNKGDIWVPHNYDRKFIGPVSLADALAHSRNIPAVRVGMDVGLDRVAETFVNLGLDRRPSLLPSMLLGAFELSVYQVTQMFQTIAASGFNSPLKSIEAVVDSEGELLSRYPLQMQQRIEPGPAFLINQGLKQVVNEGTARYAKALLPYAELAGKTGTTDDYKDSWFAGYSQDVVSTFWLGNDANQPIGFSGSSGALRLWADFMGKLRPSGLQLVQPDSLKQVVVNDQGMLVDPTCDTANVSWIYDKKSLPRADNCGVPGPAVNEPEKADNPVKSTWMDKLKSVFQ